jgi:hypothetical protein
MLNRFRESVTTVPSVRIGVSRRGLTTTIDTGSWQPEPAPRGQQFPELQVIGDKRYAGPLPTEPFLIPGTEVKFGSGNVAQMTSPGLESFKTLLAGTTERRNQIVRDIRKARRQLRWAWTLRTFIWMTATALIPAIRRAASRKLAQRRDEIANLYRNLENSVVSVDFDMESEVGAPHERMRRCFQDILDCHRLWAIASFHAIDRFRARSSAATAVSLANVTFAYADHPLVRTREDPPGIPVQEGRALAFFYPGFILVADHEDRDFALIDLTDLKIKAEQNRFTETGTVPRDATQVDVTWAKANKNGSRDLRFRNNRQLPVMGYGELHLMTDGGFNEAFMASRREPCFEFADAVHSLQAVLTTGRRNRSIGTFDRLSH